MVYEPTYNWGALQPPRAIYRWEPGPPAEKQPSLSCGFSRPGHSVEQYWRPTNSRARKQSLEYHGISWIRWWWKKYKNMTWNSRWHHKPRPSRRPGHPFGGLECQWPAEEWQDCRLASSTTGAILIISLSLSTLPSSQVQAKGYQCPFTVMFGQHSHKPFAIYTQNGIRSQITNGRPEKLQEGYSIHQRQKKTHT